MKTRSMEPVLSDDTPLFTENITDDQVIWEEDLGEPPTDSISYETTSTEVDHVTTEYDIEESFSDEDNVLIESNTANDQVVLENDNLETSSNEEDFYAESHVTNDQVTLSDEQSEQNHFNEQIYDETVHENETMIVTNNVAKMDSSLDMELSNDDDSNITFTPEYTEEYNDATAMEVDAIYAQNEVYNNNSISFSDQGTFNVIQKTVLK